MQYTHIWTREVVHLQALGPPSTRDPTSQANAAQSAQATPAHMYVVYSYIVT